MKQKELKFVVGTDINHKSVRLAVKDLVFRPAVYGLIFKAGKILLTRCWDGVDFPGGGVEMHENFEEALVREVWEETGITVTKSFLLHVNDNFFIQPVSNKKVHSIQVYYLAKNPKGIITDKNFDEGEKQTNSMAEWVNVKDIKKLKFYNSVDSINLIQKAYKIYNK